MFPKQSVIEKYTRYGFSYRKASSNESYLTFTYKSGFFHNAEIVKIKDNERDKIELKRITNDLEKAGISCTTKEYKDLNDIEDQLFNGFFSVEEWKKSITDEYSDYTQKIINSFPSKNVTYSYINSKYTKNYKEPDNSLGIVSNILEQISKPGCKLILIEAPAGFGKTCTSYEIIKGLVNNYRNFKVMPFFTEFSRDRQARIFNHVFVREVDRKFRSVKSNVVIDELQNGRLCLVLDGFDELLSDSIENNTQENNDNAEPMLSTIGDLLKNEAKVIITSRRSNLFESEMFNLWLENNCENFNFERYRIFAPTTTEWLSFERSSKLTEVGINLEKISNPVLLSYLRALDSSSFTDLCSRPHEIVSQYFNSMLEREIERQKLSINVENQTEILSIVAGDMCEKDYTSDTKEKIVELLKTKCKDILESARKSYAASERPSLDSLANTLATHAFFDRSNQGNGKIEFINEFVFGNYIAEHILSSDGEWIASDERFVEPAVNSYSARTEDERKKLWDKIDPMKDFLKRSDLMTFEFSMLGDITPSSYCGESINSITINNATLFNSGILDNSTFSDCLFKDVEFNLDSLCKITFLSCKFYDCTYSGNLKDETISFLHCTANNGIIELLDHDESETVEEDDISDLRKEIFECYLPVGSDSIGRLHIPLAIIYGIESKGYQRKEINKEIKALKNEGYIVEAKSANFIAINKAKISRMKQLLGRA